MQNFHSLQPTNPPATHTWEYHIIAERCNHPDIGTYRSYGIQVFETTGIHISPATSIHDVTTIQAQAEQLTELCNHYQLSPVHLYDVIEDYLAKIV